MCHTYSCLLCETKFPRCFGNINLSIFAFKNYLCGNCNEKVQSHIELGLNIQRADKHTIIAESLEATKQKNSSVESECLLCGRDIGKLNFTPKTSADDYFCEDCVLSFRNNIRNNIVNGEEEKHSIIISSIQTNKKRVLKEGEIQAEKERKAGLRT
jgi:hypothetical protein